MSVKCCRSILQCDDRRHRRAGADRRVVGRRFGADHAARRLERFDPIGGEGPMASLRVERWFGSAPIRELTLAAQPPASIRPGFLSRGCRSAGQTLRGRHRVCCAARDEGFDIPNITLPYGQDELIARVAKANPNTIVVLETGNPVAMPWLDNVKAVIAAWYPGQKGAQAIAEIISGKVNPSGRLPIAFPKQAADSPRPELPGLGARQWTPTTITYPEGADAGYRWYARNGITPLFPFGYGLSFTTFALKDLQVTGGNTIRASFNVTNTGQRKGADAAQLYLTSINGAPGETVDRVRARHTQAWRAREGRSRGRSAPVASTMTSMPANGASLAGPMP